MRFTRVDRESGSPWSPWRHSGNVEDYFTVRKASWEKEMKRIGDLKGKPVALNVRGAAVEWMLDQALKKDGLGLSAPVASGRARRGGSRRRG